MKGSFLGGGKPKGQTRKNPHLCGGKDMRVISEVRERKPPIQQRSMGFSLRDNSIFNRGREYGNKKKPKPGRTRDQAKKGDEPGWKSKNVGLSNSKISKKWRRIRVT